MHWMHLSRVTVGIYISALSFCTPADCQYDDLRSRTECSDGGGGDHNESRPQRQPQQQQLSKYVPGILSTLRYSSLSLERVRAVNHSVIDRFFGAPTPSGQSCLRKPVRRFRPLPTYALAKNHGKRRSWLGDWRIDSAIPWRIVG